MKAIFLILLLSGLGDPARAETFEWKDPSVRGRSFLYRLYVPEGNEPLRGAIVLAGGYNGDARSMAGEKEWVALADRTRFALVGCLARDEGGSGFYWQDERTFKSLEEALGAFSALSTHPELEKVPLAFWGMSAGGLYGYYFSYYRPERTIAFVMNKSAELGVKVSDKNREVPGLWITGERDTDSRMISITGIFAEGRRQGALWSLVIEPNAGHEVARSKALGICYLEDAIHLRLEKGGVPRKIGPKEGWLGDAGNHEIRTVEEGFPGGAMKSWFPGKNSAEFWQAVARGEPDPEWWTPVSG